MNLLRQYLTGYWKLVALALLLATINQVFSLLDPLIFQRIVDRFATHPKHYEANDYLEGVMLLLGATMGVAMISRIAKNFQDYFINVITQKLGAQIYQDGLRHSLQLPFQVFEDQRSGQTLSILQKVRTDTERLISSFVNILFSSIISIVFVTIYAFSVHWVIAPIYFAAVPLIGLMSSYLSKKIKKIQKSIVSETTSLAGSTTESLRNLELVKSLGLSRQEIDRLNGITNRILSLELKKVRYIRSLSFLQGTTINFLRTSILLVMLYLVYLGGQTPGAGITVGQFFSLMIYSFFIFGPLQEMGSLINIYREAQVSLANFEAILNTPTEVKPVQPIGLNDMQSLSFSDVSFQHKSSVSKALNGISFNVRVGESIAFVGPSGSGKTTLVKLLVGLYRPQEGEIYYNGVPGKDIDFDALRSRIGFVTQDTQLFSGTIRENLLFVNPSATDEECLEVLEKAACQTLLARADKGLDTLIGEGGVKVSGGEKQRLSIARALLRKPDLLVFDEATSALDSITEEEISKTIREISDDKAHITIMIAHRLSTVMHADKIFVLERGQIIESGRHSDLLDLKGLYYAMWRQQIGEKKADAPSLQINEEQLRGVAAQIGA